MAAIDFQRFGLVALPGLLGAVTLFLMGIQWGAGVNSDSARYMEEAYNLLASRGISSLHYPPAFSVMLAGIQATGFEIGTGARLLNTLLLGVNSTFAGLILWRVSGSTILSALGTLLMATSTDILWVHFMVWPEPAFLLAVLLTLAFTHMYLEGSHRGFLMLAALCGGVATLVRYPGLALVATVAAAQFTMSGRPRRSRVLEGLIVVVIGILPIGAWVASNGAFSGDSTVRTLAFHPVTLDRLVDGMSVASRWLVPVGPPLALRAGVSAAALVLIVFTLWRGIVNRRHQSRAAIFWVLGLIFIFCYSALLGLSITFFDAQTPLDGRIMSPILVVGSVVVLSSIYSAVSMTKGILAPGAFALLAAAFACSYIARAWDWGIMSYTDGRGYTSRVWVGSETMTLAKALPADTVIYSNAADVIEVLLRRDAHMVPRRFDPTSLLPNSRYRDEIERIRLDLESSSAVLVDFEAMRRPYLPGLAELTHSLGLVELAHASDGGIYRRLPTASGYDPSASHAKSPP